LACADTATNTPKKISVEVMKKNYKTIIFFFSKTFCFWNIYISIYILGRKPLGEKKVLNFLGMEELTNERPVKGS